MKIPRMKKINLIGNYWSLILTLKSFPSIDAVQDKPYQLPSIRPDAEKPNPKLGVGAVSFSYNSLYMATKNGKTVFTL